MFCNLMQMMKERKNENKVYGILYRVNTYNFINHLDIVLFWLSVSNYFSFTSSKKHLLRQIEGYPETF